jgi:hypothetical protein
MRVPCFLSYGFVVLMTASCSQSSQQSEKAAAEGASASAAAPASAQIGEADRAAVLKTASLKTNTQGQVKNECDEWVMPQLLPVDLGGTVGPAVLLAMEGGPKLASCYGDGPGLTLFRRVDGNWKEIYSSRGASLAIAKERHNGAPVLVYAGPGQSHPVFEWKGSTYEPSKRTVPDNRVSNMTILP